MPPARPDDVTTYGDFETGYIVTPTLPPTLTPSPRPPKASKVATDPVREYTAQHPARIAAGEQFLALVTSVLDEGGINYLSVTGRTKTVASFAEKARRTRDGVPLYTDPLREITDTIGIRVITYVHSDVSAVADLLRDQVVVHDDRDMGQETAQEGRFGYASRHLLIGLDAAREGHPSYELMRGHTAQVQIRTVLQHAWAEFEHDIRYKGTMPDEHARDFDRRFTLAAGLLELADREFSTIRDTLRASAASATETDGVPDNDPRIDPRELAAFLAGQYAEAGWSRTDHYAWISGLLLELGITSLDELGETLRAGDEGLIAERMDYRYPPGAVRRLDDALLAAYGSAYVALPGNAHRRAALESRLDRLTGNALGLAVSRPRRRARGRGARGSRPPPVTGRKCRRRTPASPGTTSGASRSSRRRSPCSPSTGRHGPRGTAPSPTPWRGCAWSPAGRRRRRRDLRSARTRACVRCSRLRARNRRPAATRRPCRGPGVRPPPGPSARRG